MRGILRTVAATQSVSPGRGVSMTSDDDRIAYPPATEAARWTTTTKTSTTSRPCWPILVSGEEPAPSSRTR